jgi:adenine-specific DNA-methyltransferase
MNAYKADYIRFKLDEMKKDNIINNDEYIYLVGSLIISLDCVANTACVYGAYLKNFKKSAKESIVLKPIHINMNNLQNNKVFNENINSDTIYNIMYDICYFRSSI